MIIIIVEEQLSSRVVHSMAYRVINLVFTLALLNNLFLAAFASTKFQDIDISSPVIASSIISKCLAPLSKVLFGETQTQPVCSVKEFTRYSAETLMQLNQKQINSLPPGYFKHLKIEQASLLSPSFIGNLKKEQAMSFPSEMEKVLPEKSRKLLGKIKNKPGPIARAVIMTLSAFTAFIVFKYS